MRLSENHDFSEIRGLRQHAQVELLQDQTHLMLQEYCQSRATSSSGLHAGSSSSAVAASKVRFGRLLLLLPGLNSIAAKSVEALFFRKTVGNIAVEKVIGDLFQGH